MPINDSSTPRTSKGAELGDRYSGTRRGPKTKRISSTGTLIKKTEPHQNWWRRAPPITGPMADPPANAAVHMPMAFARAMGSGNMLLISDRLEGRRVAPPMPMMARAAMSALASGANAAIAEATPKRLAPTSSSLRRPNRSPRLPIVINRPAMRKP